MDPTKCQEWLINRNKVPIVNPLTNRTLTLGGPTYQKLDKDCMTTTDNKAANNKTEPEAFVKSASYATAPQEIIIGLTDTGKGMWVCGPATYTYKDDIVALGGTWNASKKCWIFAITKLDDLAKFFATKNVIVHLPNETPSVKKTPITGSSSASVKSTKTINAKTITVTTNGNNMIYICGQSTYGIKGWLKDTLKAKWDPVKKCWFINDNSKASLIQYLNESKLEWMET